MNGMPDGELNVRKKQLVLELNSFIGLKKAYAAGTAQGSDPAGSSASRELSQKRVDGKDNHDLLACPCKSTPWRPSPHDIFSNSCPYCDDFLN